MIIEPHLNAAEKGSTLIFTIESQVHDRQTSMGACLKITCDFYHTDTKLLHWPLEVHVHYYSIWATTREWMLVHIVNVSVTIESELGIHVPVELFLQCFPECSRTEWWSRLVASCPETSEWTSTQLRQWARGGEGETSSQWNALCYEP